MSTLKASVTIYLSVTFTLIISLILSTVESCHFDSLVSRAHGITYLSLDSLFGQYCLPLFERYGLFCINDQSLDLSEILLEYGEKNAQLDNLIPSLNKSFLSLDCSSFSIDSTEYITDNDCEEFVRQICDNLPYIQVDNIDGYLSDFLSVSYPQMYPTDEKGSANINLNYIDTEPLKDYMPAESEDSSTSIDISKIDAENFESTICEKISNFFRNGIISCVVEKPSSVSSLSIDRLILPSVTCTMSAEGESNLNGYKGCRTMDEVAKEKYAVTQYIKNKFTSYTDVTSSDSSSSDNSSSETALKYQLEYIIFGAESDYDNLINTAAHLIVMRTGLNLLHLLSDKDKFNAVKEIAGIANAIPIVSNLTHMAILTAWATAEGIIDVRDLLSGKRVQFIKDEDHWNLSLEGLSNFSKKSPSSNKGDDGLTYEEFLDILLMCQDNSSTYYRTMDLIQMDMCHLYDENFRLAKCATSIKSTATYKLPALFFPFRPEYTVNADFNYKLIK